MEIVDENILTGVDNKSKNHGMFNSNDNIRDNDTHSERKSAHGVAGTIQNKNSCKHKGQLDDDKSCHSTSGYNTDTTSESTVVDSLHSFSSGNSNLSAAWDSVPVRDFSKDDDLVTVGKFTELTDFNFDDDDDNDEKNEEDDSFLDRLTEYLVREWS
jgi:hypothetical protein